MTDTELFTRELTNSFRSFTDMLLSKVSALELNTDRDVLSINQIYKSLTDTRTKLAAIQKCTDEFAANLQEIGGICVGAGNRCDDILRAMNELVETNVITKEEVK